MTKKIIGAALLAVFGLAVLMACEEAPSQSGSEEGVVAGGYDSEVYAKKVDIRRHEYYVVYVTCDGSPGHLVRKCVKNHCFLHHSPDCLCRKAQVPAVATDDAETEDADPFNW